MSRSKFDRLIDQFYEREGSPRTQQVILRQIVRMHDPQAIPELLAIYKRKDAPAGLRRIAGQGLSEFWQLNQRVSQGARGAQFATLGPWLRRLRIGLAAVLAVTLIINAAILIARSLPAPVPPPQTVPSTVEALAQFYLKRINDAKDVASNLRARWGEVEGNINVNCAALPTPISPVNPAQVDLKTYPGIQLVTTDLNAAISQISQVQAGLTAICAAPTNDTQVSSDVAAGQIVIIGEKIDPVLDSAGSDLTRWLAAPIPSATPSPIPSASAVPSVTNTAGPSPTPTQTLTPSATITATLVPTNTPIQTTSLGGLGLNALTSYEYVMTITAAGTQVSDGTAVADSLTIKALRPSAPLTAAAQAQYDIGVTESTPWLQTLNPLFKAGQVQHVLLNGSYYINTLLPSTVPCSAGSSADGNGKLVVPLDGIDPGNFLKPFNGIVLTRVTPDQPVDGVSTVHYHLDKTIGSDPNTVAIAYDLLVSADQKQIPLQATYTVTGPVTNDLTGLANAPIPATEKLTSYTISFSIDQIDPTIALKVPLGCPSSSQ